MSALFSPLTLADTVFANRIVVSPMCQYSATDGAASDWHLQHLGQYAVSGAGLVMVEATAVHPAGRITPNCLGLYSDAQELALRRVIDVCRSVSNTRMGIQLAHAGRKASCHVPWKGGGSLTAAEGGWQPVAPSPIAYDERRRIPAELGLKGMLEIRDAFAFAARRAERTGFDVLELHAAHGYLLHSFMSPITNQRNDDYGGSLENRIRFPLEVAGVVRDVWPAERPLGARLNACDFLDGGAPLEDTIECARRLKSLGYDYVCVSAGSMVGGQQFNVFPGYLIEYAARLREEAGIATQGVGLITEPLHAESAVAQGKVDMVVIARAFLDDPRWVWHAARKLGADIEYPLQYAAVHPSRWPPVAAQPQSGSTHHQRRSSPPKNHNSAQ